MQLDISNVEDSLRTFILEYRSGNRDIRQLVSSESMRAQENVSISSEATIQAIGGIQKRLNGLILEAEVQIDQARRERLLHSLKFPGLNERRNQVSEAYENTFQWIFMGDAGPSQEDTTGFGLEDVDLADPSGASWDIFSNWLRSTAQIYWISGKPASGKTTLVKYVLNHPKTDAYLNIWSPRTLKISHFFWRPGNKMQQSIKGLLCSLLYQLLDNSVAATNYVLQYIQDQKSGVKDTDTDWSVSEVRSIFLQILSSYERPICIFIDGLDEVDPADGPLELLDLVEQFPRCRNMKLCLASRPEPLLQGRLSAYPHLRLQDLTRADLDRYARDHIKLTRAIHDEDTVNSSWSSNAPWHPHPIKSIVDKAEGVFLWLVLAIKSVNKGFAFGDTLSMIQERISCLPGDLTKLYKDMWNRACEDSPEAYRQIAALYFRLILFDTQDLEPFGIKKLSVLQLMLASTSIADKLLDAIEKPSDLVPEEKMLKECREIERSLELYCFGLLETIQEMTRDQVVGWYGSRYNTLWSYYGRRRLLFIHRTAEDFLLDTVDGKEILGRDASSESSILFRWIKAHLATSQLYADTHNDFTFTRVANSAEAYTFFLYSNYANFGPYDPNFKRTIFYFERLCGSGQLLSGRSGGMGRFCGGVDFLKVAGRICCDESIWPITKRRTLSTVTISEILLNLCDNNRLFDLPCNRYQVEHRINTLLHEGADPNWRGTTFMPERCFNGEYSRVHTPFTAYLTRVLETTVAVMRIKPYHIAEVLGNLHAFLSHSAHLGHMLAVIFSNHHSLDGNAYSYSSETMDHTCGEFLGFEQMFFTSGNSVFVSFSAHTIIEALLDYVRAEFKHPQFREEVRYGEIMRLIVSIQEHLDNWSKRSDDRIIGIFAPDGEESERQGAVWYVPCKEGPAGVANELLKESGFSSMIKQSSCARRCGIISKLVQQTSWTVQAEGLEETLDSFAELGIIVRVDCEMRDTQGWVDKFRNKTSVEEGFADCIEVAQSCLGSLVT